MSLRIGVDVGGTNTDAVVMDERDVIAWTKQPTTADVTSGVENALANVLADAGIGAVEVAAVMIGTTHFTNALAQARDLMPTAAIRIGHDWQDIPPMAEWPARLRSAVGGEYYTCGGGHEFDGRPIRDLDEQRLREIAADIRAKGFRSIAISSVFSPVDAGCELRARKLLAELVPEASITMSHALGTIGLLERENATIINACLQGLAPMVVQAFRAAIASSGVSAPMYLSQNDGTLMSSDYALLWPVAAIASGPTNSMRGAAYLSGLRDCAVIDIGGTTSDAGVLRHGFPREASSALDLGGVRTNFRMPDVLSVPLGGGSVVRHDSDNVTVGPDSVGFRLTSKALVFGGNTLTATDIAVAAGLATGIGDSARVRGLDRDLVQRAANVIDETVSETVDRMKTTKGTVSVVVVGGGSVLVGDQLRDLEVVRPEQAGVANAIGAAIAQVGGEIDRVYSLESIGREEVFERAKREAVERAVRAGAVPTSVQVVDIEDIPLSHLPEGTAVRVRVKAIGDLEMRRSRDAVVR